MNRSVYILGINQDHNATAALLKNDQVIGCVSEERFNRIKNFSGLPIQAIQYCLDFAGISPEILDLIIVASRVPPPIPELGFKSVKNITSYKLLKLIYNFLLNRIEWSFPLFKTVNEKAYALIARVSGPIVQKERATLIKETLGIDPRKIVFVDHHECHAYTALYGAPFLKEGFKKVLVCTCDAEGDGLAATISIYSNGKLHRVAASSQSNSLGLFYTAITQFLGMKPMEHEYKVMGLAPYAPAREIERLFCQIQDWVIVNKKNLTFETKVNAHQFLRLFFNKLRYERFDVIAGAAQKLCEVRLAEWVESAIEKTGISSVAASGGVFMNVKANKILWELKGVKEFFVFPSGGDESNAFGGCYWGYKQINPHCIPQPIKDLYLGPSFSPEDIAERLNKTKGIIVKRPKNIEEEIASLLSQGNIVARFEGRAEWGARALGNRSVLADPSNPAVVEIINKAIKNRDFWMPFAPVIINECKYRYLLLPKKTFGHYMIMAYDTKKDIVKDLVAAIHPYDKTARAQILYKSWNPSLWKILYCFYQKTGRGVLLNTSFNIHGEPIVGSPDDALDTFKRSGLKYLAIGPYIVRKG